MNESRNRATITFYSNIGEVVQISIPRANIENTSVSVRSAMEGIIGTGIVVTGKGVPQTVRTAEIVRTVRDNLLP